MRADLVMRFRVGRDGICGRARRCTSAAWLHRSVRVAALAVALAGLEAAASGPAGAQSSSPSQELREIYIGTFGVKATAASVGAVERDSMSVSEATSAAGMLADGLGRLGAGDSGGASRQFEQLVARYPDSQEAGHARRYLGEVYRARSDQRPAEPRPPARAAAPAAITAPGGSASTAEAAKIGEGWRVSVRTETLLEHRLISEVGDRVFFAAGSAELGSRARGVLSAQAVWLKKQPSLDAVIEGHADEPGSDVENLVLSEARAEAVRGRLIEEGVAPERLVIEARGRAERLVECMEPECAAQNRRALTVPFTRDERGVPVTQLRGGAPDSREKRATAVSSASADLGRGDGSPAR